MPVTGMCQNEVISPFFKKRRDLDKIIVNIPSLSQVVPMAIFDDIVIRDKLVVTIREFVTEFISPFSYFLTESQPHI
jgi:hypothetical protein